MVGSAPSVLASLSRRLARSLGRCHLSAGPRAALHLVRSCATVDRLDGLTITLPDGAWFNLRPSNTESLLRLNLNLNLQVLNLWWPMRQPFKRAQAGQMMLFSPCVTC